MWSFSLRVIFQQLFFSPLIDYFCYLALSCIIHLNMLIHYLIHLASLSGFLCLNAYQFFTAKKFTALFRRCHIFCWFLVPFPNPKASDFGLPTARDRSQNKISAKRDSFLLKMTHAKQQSSTRDLQYSSSSDHLSLLSFSLPSPLHFSPLLPFFPNSCHIY